MFSIWVRGVLHFAQASVKSKDWLIDLANEYADVYGAPVNIMRGGEVIMTVLP
jgi:hypothetical protein